MSDVQGRPWPFTGDVALTAPGTPWRCDGGVWRVTPTVTDEADAVVLTVTESGDGVTVLDVGAEVDRLVALAGRRR